MQQNSFHHDIFYIHDYLSLHATTSFYYYLRVFLFHARTHVLILLLALSLGKGPVVEVVIYGLWLLAPNGMFYSVLGGSCCLSPLHSGELR